MSSKEPEYPATMVDCDGQFHQIRGIAALENRLQRHVAMALGLPMECVTPSTRFVEDLGLNVLSALEIVLSLEALLKVQLPDAEAAHVNCVKDFLGSLSKTAFVLTER